MTEAERVLTQRVAQLEGVLEKFIPMVSENFAILQESIALRSIENAVLRRVVADLDRRAVYSSGGITVETGDVRRLEGGGIDFPRYEAEYYAVQGLVGFVETYIEWKKLNPDPEPEEPEADYVFGG